MPPERRSQNPIPKTPLIKTPTRPKPVPKPAAPNPVAPIRLPRRVRPTQSEERALQEEVTQLEGREDFSPSLTTQMQREKRARNAGAKQILSTNLDECRAVNAEATRSYRNSVVLDVQGADWRDGLHSSCTHRIGSRWTGVAMRSHAPIGCDAMFENTAQSCNLLI